MNNLIEKCKNTRILQAIGGICIILGTIMPYVKYSFWGITYTVSLIKIWKGKILLVLAILELIYVFKDFMEIWIPALFNTNIGQKLKQYNNSKISLIFTVIATTFVIYLTMSIKADLFKYYNIGFYLMWLGIICLVTFEFLHKNSNS